MGPYSSPSSNNFFIVDFEDSHLRIARGEKGNKGDYL